MKKFNGVLIEVKDEDIKLLYTNPNEFWKDVKSIDDYAFTDCSSLTEIAIPDNITNIGTCAFRNCKALTKIKLPNGINSIEDGVFWGCESLLSITLPNSVKSIGESSFGWCNNLTKITIPEGVEVVKTSTFEGCSKLTEVIIPSSVTSIEAKAFYHCTSLEKITLPENLLNLGIFAFYNCQNLTSINIPETITTIKACTFFNCKKLNKIKIPNNVTSIKNGAFENCINLTNLTIPESVTSIGDNVFENIKNLNIKGKSICGDLLTPEVFDLIKSKQNFNTKSFNKLYYLAKDKGLKKDDLNAFVTLCINLGILEESKIKMGNGKDGNPNLVPVSDVVFTFMQGIINSGQLDLSKLHHNFQDLKIQNYNEEFTKFVINKTNWHHLSKNLKILPSVYEWFKYRSNLDLKQNNGISSYPSTEENRYKVCVYKPAQNGADRIYWQAPTLDNIFSELAKTKFKNVNTQRDDEIADELGKFHIYSQKHFDKAQEIDKERITLGVKDILQKKVKQSFSDSLNEYKSKTQALREQILNDSAEILNKQTIDFSSVFTYEVLSKSDVANFSIGCLTSCCATLYGVGGGAMRAMIIHPDIQPLAIRDCNGIIIAFGIIYVNRKKGYAVVNNFEVNSIYSEYSKREAIYKKAMQCVNEFVSEYNAENPENPITKVTSGTSPNWLAINDFIKKNPKSNLLPAPNFDKFNYVGSGSWPGDWYREQYEIYNKHKKDEKEFSKE